MFFSETVWITLFFKPKMDVISTIIVFGFLEIQSNNIPVDDKLIKMYSKSNYQVTKLPRCILNQINKTYTCTCLGYEFCFQQHVTRQLYFFKPLSTYLRLNKNPGCLFFPFFLYNRLFIFYGNSVNVHFQRWFTVFPIHIINSTIRKLKGCFIPKRVSISKMIYFWALF